MINYNKTEIFFSRNVADDVQTNLSVLLGVNICLGTGKYLGVPSMVGRSKKDTFTFIKDRVWHKISSWSGRCLFMAGREVLINLFYNPYPHIS